MEILRGGQKVELVGNPPEVGDQLPKFKVFTAKGAKVKTRDLLGKPLLLSVVPDLNTRVCSIQTKAFNQQADNYPEVRFVTISNNLPQDQANWCAAEGVTLGAGPQGRTSSIGAVMDTMKAQRFTLSDDGHHDDVPDVSALLKRMSSKAFAAS